MNSIKKFITAKMSLNIGVLFLFSFTSHQKNMEIKQVNCQKYAMEVMEVIERHFGCIEDSTSYNFAYSQAVTFCEGIDQ